MLEAQEIYVFFTFVEKYVKGVAKWTVARMIAFVFQNTLHIVFLSVLLKSALATAFLYREIFSQ